MNAEVREVVLRRPETDAVEIDDRRAPIGEKDVLVVEISVHHYDRTRLEHGKLVRDLSQSKPDGRLCPSDVVGPRDGVVRDARQEVIRGREGVKPFHEFGDAHRDLPVVDR